MRIEEALPEEEIAKLTAGNYCYHDSFNRLVDNHIVGKHMTLVHGRPTLTGGPHAGKEYGHAWLEYEMPLPMSQCTLTVCIDGNTGDEIPAALYYLFGHIDEEQNKTYTFEQAQELALKTGHSGPWE
jgi:hypothetical protein